MYNYDLSICFANSDPLKVGLGTDIIFSAKGDDEAIRLAKARRDYLKKNHHCREAVHEFTSLRLNSFKTWHINEDGSTMWTEREHVYKEEKDN